MDIIWRVAFSQRPDYISEESPVEFNGGHLVTEYRLLVSGVTVFSGVTKSLLVYCGLSEEVTWIEWFFGVVVTTR